MTDIHPRHHAGTPVGGRFAAIERRTADFAALDMSGAHDGIQRDLELHDNGPYAPLNVHLVMPGESYGRTGAIVNNDNEPLIEFYDARYPHTDHGQFVSSYTMRSLSENPPLIGLRLDGGIPDWTATAPNVHAAVQLAKRAMAVRAPDPDGDLDRDAQADKVKALVADYKVENDEAQRKLSELQGLIDDPLASNGRPAIREARIASRDELKRVVAARKAAQLDELMNILGTKDS